MCIDYQDSGGNTNTNTLEFNYSFSQSVSVILTHYFLVAGNLFKSLLIFYCFLFNGEKNKIKHIKETMICMRMKQQL